MKILILFVLHMSLLAYADVASETPKTSDIIQQEQQTPEQPVDKVDLEKINTSPNPVQDAEDESSDAILNPKKNPGIKQKQEDNEDEGSDEGTEDNGEEVQGEYQSDEMKG